MRFNENLEFKEIDISWITEEDVLSETVMIPWLPVSEALSRGQDLTRFFINEVLSAETRNDPQTRINTELVVLHNFTPLLQSWHLDFPKGYKLPQEGELTFLSLGDRRKTQVCGATEIPKELAKGSWYEPFNALIEEKIASWELAVQDVPTGTRIQSSKPFIHRGGPRYGAGFRWFADAYRPLS